MLPRFSKIIMLFDFSKNKILFHPCKKKLFEKTKKSFNYAFSFCVGDPFFENVA